MNIVQVGLGNWGKNHNRILKEKGHDVTTIEVEDNYNDYLSIVVPKTDAVIVTTSSVMHFPILLQCLKRGIPVFCEKPITTKRSQLTTLSSFKDSFFMSGHQLVFADEIKELRLRDIQYMSSIRSGAIARDEGALMSLAVHDIAILYYLQPTKYYVKSAQGNKHEAHIYLSDGSRSADIYVKSLSDVKLRHSVFVDDLGRISRFTPECWNRQDLLEKELDYFLDCVKKNETPKINDLETSIRIMETVFEAKEKLETK
jgi:predicted dehydrogenase